MRCPACCSWPVVSAIALHRADGRAAAAGGTAGVPGGGRISVDGQGVESAVLAVAGPAGGAGAAASPDSVGVDDDRRIGVGAADVLPLRRARTAGYPSSGSPPTVLLRDIAVMVMCALVVRQIYRPELDSGAMRRTGRRSGGRGVRPGAPMRRPAGCPMAAPAGGPDRSRWPDQSTEPEDEPDFARSTTTDFADQWAFR